VRKVRTEKRVDHCDDKLISFVFYIFLQHKRRMINRLDSITALRYY